MKDYSEQTQSVAWFDDSSVPPRRREVYGILASVWGAALDAASSRDFRSPDGELDETAYLRYQARVFERAAQRVESWSETQPG